MEAMMKRKKKTEKKDTVKKKTKKNEVFFRIKALTFRYVSLVIWCMLTAHR